MRLDTNPEFAHYIGVVDTQSRFGKSTREKTMENVATEQPTEDTMETATESPLAKAVSNWLAQPSLISCNPENPEDREFLEMLRSAAEAHNLQLATNFAPDDLDSLLLEGPNGTNIPAGYEIQVQPLKQRSASAGEKMEMIALCIFSVPTFATVVGFEQNGEKVGEEFIYESLKAAFSTKISNSVRPAQGSTKLKSESLPRTVLEFIASRRTSVDTSTFNELATSIVKILRENGMRTMSKSNLRQVFMSKAQAATLYPAVDDRIWVDVLDLAISTAQSKNLDPATLIQWRDDREQASAIDDIDGLSLADFKSMTLE